MTAPAKTKTAATADVFSTESGSLMEQLVTETIMHLTTAGVSGKDMAPLLRLKTVIREVQQGGPGADQVEARGQGEEASDAVLARASAVIDLLVQAGIAQEHAAQTVARQLLASGVQMPVSGGDARGWKRLLKWRTRLQHGNPSARAKSEYERFKQELNDIPPGQRLARVVENRLWDRRAKTRADT